MLGSWKSRALAAEAELEAVRNILDGIDLRFQDRTALMSIVRVDRKIRFGFVRYNEPFYIEVYGSWDDDVDEWTRQLLQPRKPNDG